MVKKILFLAIILASISAFSQSDNNQNTPQQLIKDFFEAFHKKDTVSLKKFADIGARLGSVSENPQGDTKLTTEDFSKFLKSIASIPADVTFREELHEFRVEENGALATVTTPYSFYYNGNFSHCGVNSFQLVKFNGEWKIVYLIDTRTRTDCDQS